MGIGNEEKRVVNASELEDALDDLEAFVGALMRLGEAIGDESDGRVVYGVAGAAVDRFVVVRQGFECLLEERRELRKAQVHSVKAGLEMS